MKKKLDPWIVQVLERILKAANCWIPFRSNIENDKEVPRIEGINWKLQQHD